MSGQVPGGQQTPGSAPAAQTSAAQTTSQAGASPVEDGRSPVAGTARRELSIGTKLGFLALIGVLGLGFIWFNALFSHKRGVGRGAAQTLYTNGGEVFAGPPAQAAKPELQSLPAPAEDERETVLMLRNGQTEVAIHRKDENGTLKIVPGGYEEAVEYIAQLWRQRREANRDRVDFSISVSAPSNAEAHDISRAIRQQRRDRGEIGIDVETLRATDGAGERDYELALAVGDRVRLFRRTNAKFTETGTVGNIGRNGTVLEIAAINEAGLTLKTITGREGLVTWESLRGEPNGRVQLACGDALTTNIAQGSTVTEHIHAMPAGTKLVSAFGAYTSGSRHREQSFIVTSEGVERAEIIARRPLGDRREIGRADVLNNIVRNFAQAPEKQAALALMECAAGLRRGAVQAVQRVHQAAEARGNGLERPSVLRERMLSRRIAQAFEKQLPGLAAQLRRHGEALGRVARIGADLTEMLANLARRQAASRQSDMEFWRELGQRAERVPGWEKQPRQSRRRGR